MNRFPRLFPLLKGLGLLVALGAVSVSCDKVPLLAPSGTVINLTVASDAAALNSTVDVIAVLIENGQTSGTGTGTAATTSSTTGAGTPVQNGTVVSFTTSIGTIEPAEARTSNGRVTVQLKTTGESGTATITAYSGGARSTAQIKIGAANAKTITVTANPQNLPANGGSATVIARVDDSNGNGIAGIPVLFSTTKGTLSPTTVVTGNGGTASTTLTTTSAADVTATAGSLTGVKVSIGVAPHATVSVTGPTTSVPISAPASFTVNTGTTVPVSNVTINFGDGAVKNLGTFAGSSAATHFYSRSGIFDVTVTATDADGVPATAVTQVAVTGLSGTVASSPASPIARGTAVTFTVTMDQTSASIDSYTWTFPKLGGTTSFTSTGKSQSYVIPSDLTPGTYTITVTVNPLYGSSFDIKMQLVVTGP